MNSINAVLQENREYQPPPGYHVFKLRVADLPDKDFIEVEVSGHEILTYHDFLQFCCYEFDIPSINFVEKIRKLPCTRVRSEADIKRFKTFESFELVLVDPERLNKSL